MSLWRGFKDGFRHLGQEINSLVNLLLLFPVYILGIGLTSIIARISGKKFLDTKEEENDTTYWRELRLTKQETEDYLRQF